MPETEIQTTPDIQKTDNELVKVFCLDGVVVKLPLKEVLKRLPYYFMEAQKQRLMRTALDIQEKNDIHFLASVASFELFVDFPNAEVIENINKATANIVSAVLSGKILYGENDDGVLRL
jgi:hypothetical protein